jgi:hypothetical protein
MLRSAVTVALFLAANIAFADSQTEILERKPGQDPHYTSFYQIDESSGHMFELPSPEKMMELADEAVNAGLSLMNWDLNRQDWPEPGEKYDRAKHFGSWLKEGDCTDTRADILARDSSVPVKYGSSGCTVKVGRWDDPYSGQTITDASKMQIDHMVPLKNAYESGAWKWDHKHRCAYANFIANDFHLLAVSGHENMSKGDSTPSEWMPDNKQYTCEYLKNWLSIKLIWGLIMNPEETAGIQKLFTQYHCDQSAFQMSASELAKERRAISERLAACN